jgi:XTP/dITP diphosphohydrolase
VLQETSKSKLVFATNNQHKFKEIMDVLGNKIDLISLEDLGFTGDIPEEHHTLEANALQKANTIYNLYGVNCFADDTGLEITALDGEPGVYSARYAGEKCTFEDNITKVLKKMTDVKNRNACFITVIALVENGIHKIFTGKIVGEITTERKGNNGFGYDPIFKPKGYHCTFAEMSLEEKNLISHRAIAVAALKDYLIKG